MLLFNFWTHDVSCFTVRSILSVCAWLQVLHITLVCAEYSTRIGLHTVCGVTN